MARRKRLDRNELLRKSVEVIRKNGFQATSIEDLADQFQFSKPALYYYVESKESLLYEIYEQTIREWTSEVRQIRELPDLSPDERIHQVIRRFLRFCVDHDEMVIFFTEKINLSDEHFQNVSEQEREVIELIVAIIEDGMRGGQFVKGSAKTLAFGIIGMVAWTYRWYSLDGPISPEDLADSYHQILSRGYLRETNRS